MAAKNRFNHIDCLAAALPDEEYFVFLARDPAFPAILGIWASLRVGNFKAASENFMLLMQPELVRHYQNHPDTAKSEEAIATANRGMEWRARNVGDHPNARPTWKDSLVRPQMIDLEIIPEHPPCQQLAEDAAYLREKGRQLGYDQGGDKLIEIANRLSPEGEAGNA